MYACVPSCDLCIDLKLIKKIKNKNKKKVDHYVDYLEVEPLPDVSADMVVTFCKVGRRGAMRQSQLPRE